MAGRRVDQTAQIVAPARPLLQRASALAALAHLLWLVQAWAVAAAIAGLLGPAPALISPLTGALIFLGVAALRAGAARGARSHCGRHAVSRRR